MAFVVPAAERLWRTEDPPTATSWAPPATTRSSESSRPGQGSTLAAGRMGGPVMPRAGEGDQVESNEPP